MLQRTENTWQAVRPKQGRNLLPILNIANQHLCGKVTYFEQKTSKWVRTELLKTQNSISLGSEQVFGELFVLLWLWSGNVRLNITFKLVTKNIADYFWKLILLANSKLSDHFQFILKLEQQHLPTFLKTSFSPDFQKSFTFFRINVK